MEVNNNLCKYALMPIVKQVGWYDGLWEKEREYGVVAYVAMECYLFEENKKYKKNGDFEISYLVSFAKSDHDFSTPIEPNYSSYYNSVKVKKIFDTLEEAKTYEEEENNKLVKYLVRCEYVTKEKAEELFKEYYNKTQIFVKEAEKRRIKPKQKIKRP